MVDGTTDIITEAATTGIIGTAAITVTADGSSSPAGPDIIDIGRRR